MLVEDLLLELFSPLGHLPPATQKQQDADERDQQQAGDDAQQDKEEFLSLRGQFDVPIHELLIACLLYNSDAAAELNGLRPWGHSLHKKNNLKKYKT